MNPIIFHIDVNSAYLSWTALELLQKNPDGTDIRTIPSIIGGDRATRHGIVLAKSLPAKTLYKIETAEPVASALRKCPNLTVVPPDHELWRGAAGNSWTICARSLRISNRSALTNATSILQASLTGMPLIWMRRVRSATRSGQGWVLP